MLFLLNIIMKMKYCQVKIKTMWLYLYQKNQNKRYNSSKQIYRWCGILIKLLEHIRYLDLEGILKQNIENIKETA